MSDGQDVKHGSREGCKEDQKKKKCRAIANLHGVSHVTNKQLHGMERGGFRERMRSLKM